MYLITEHYKLIEFYAETLKLPEHLCCAARSSAEKASLLVQVEDNAQAASLIADSLDCLDPEHLLNVALMKDLIWFTLNLQSLKENSLTGLRRAVGRRFAEILTRQYFLAGRVAKEIASLCIHATGCDREFKAKLHELVAANQESIILRTTTFHFSVYLTYMSASVLPEIFGS